MRHRSKLTALLLLISAPALSQMTETQLLDAARSIARLLQLSPAGTELWAHQSVKRAIGESYRALDYVDLQIGQELAKPSPDRHRLDVLIEQYAAESGAIERRRKRGEIDDAFHLSTMDRQKVGLFISKKYTDSTKKQRPVLAPLP